MFDVDIASIVAGLTGGGGSAWLFNKARSERNEKDIAEMNTEVADIKKTIAEIRTDIAQRYVTKTDHIRLEDRINERFDRLTEKVDNLPDKVITAIRSFKND